MAMGTAAADGLAAGEAAARGLFIGPQSAAATCGDGQMFDTARRCSWRAGLGSGGPWKIFGAMRRAADPPREAARFGRQPRQQGVGDAEMAAPIRPRPVSQPAKLGCP